MQIKLKKLTLTNFKGIPHLEISFNGITNIYGENAAGKTTIFDAFTWLCFDKDSTNRTMFGLKPISKDGKVSQKIDVEVSAIIEADSKRIEIKKVLHEKWVKKRGEKDVTFEGNENLFYWNDVPLQLKQYQEKIADLVNEHVFKLITNPLYFNSLKWQERRAVLLEIAGEISNNDLIALNPDFEALANILYDKTLDEYKKEVSAKKKKIKDDLISIPTRIDELNRNMPEKADFNALRKNITEKENEIADIDATLLDATKSMQAAFDARRKQQNDLHQLKTKATNLKNEISNQIAEEPAKKRQKISSIKSQISICEAESKILLDKTQFHIKNIEKWNTELSNLRTMWSREDAKKLNFNEDEFICPTCKREMDADHIHDEKEKLTANFNTDKARKLGSLAEQATSLKQKISDSEAAIKGVELLIAGNEEKAASLHTELNIENAEYEALVANAENALNDALSFSVDYNKILFEIDETEKQVFEDVKPDDNTALKEKKQALKSEVDTLNRQLNDEDIIKKTTQRRDELEEQEKDLAQQLADLEASEYLAAQFNRAKMDMLVERINGRFKYVRFNMFNYTQDGGEIPTCETLVDCVPFPDANNAAKINAGLDIINTLCEHYNVYAPIFIDNRESVSELIDCNSQIVNLIVSPAEKKLRIA